MFEKADCSFGFHFYIRFDEAFFAEMLAGEFGDDCVQGFASDTEADVFYDVGELFPGIKGQGFGSLLTCFAPRARVASVALAFAADWAEAHIVLAVLWVQAIT